MVTIADWQSNEQKVRYLTVDGGVGEATVRGGQWGDESGTRLAPSGTPLEDTYVRFTLRSGLESFRPFRDVLQQHRDGEIAEGW